MTTPKKYRLTRDHLGWAKGTEFWFVAPRLDSVTRFTPYYYAQGRVEGSLPVAGVEETPDLFEPIPDTPERPYPWEPKEDEEYWVADILCARADRDRNEGGEWDANRVRVGNAFRTKKDAELRLRLEPLVNAAAKALLNSRDVPNDGNGSRYWRAVMQKTGVFQAIEGGWVGSGVSSAARPGYFYKEQDAQAVADLYNFFLSTTST